MSCFVVCRTIASKMLFQHHTWLETLQNYGGLIMNARQLRAEQAYDARHINPHRLTCHAYGGTWCLRPGLSSHEDMHQY